MRALRVGALAPAAPACDCHTLPDPEPRTDSDPHAIIVAVHAAALNYADVLQRAGRYALRPPKVPPYTPAIEFAGTVLTSASPRFPVGTRVAGIHLAGGACADRLAVANPDHIVPIPDSWTAAQGAALPVNYLTAHLALTAAAVRPGHWVLITAATGGVGSAAVILAKARGAKVCAVSSSPDKLRRLRAEVCPTLDAAVAYTPGKWDAFQTDIAGKADVVLDGVGGPLLDAAIAALADFGSVVTFGLASGQLPQASYVKLLVKNAAVHGVNLDLVSQRRPAHIAASLRTILHTLHTAGDLRPHVGRVFPFTGQGGNDAFATLEAASPDTLGKLVIDLAGGAVCSENPPPGVVCGPRVHRRLISTRFGHVNVTLHSPPPADALPEPLVLLHMTPRSGDEYREFVQHAAATHAPRTYVLVDTLGYGASDDAPEMLTVEDHAEALLAVVDALGFDKVSLLGHLTGAYIAMEFAIGHPHRVRSLVLAGMVFFDEQLRKSLRDWTESQAAPDHSNPQFLVDMWKKRADYGDQRLNLRCVRDELRSGSHEGHGHASVAHYQMDKRMALLTSRTLLLRGRIMMKRIDAIGWKMSDNVHRIDEAIPHAKVHIVDDGDMLMCNKMAPTLATLVNDFLSADGTCGSAP